MWASPRFIAFLTILETIFDNTISLKHMYIEEDIVVTKKFQPVTVTHSTSAATQEPKVVTWKSIPIEEETIARTDKGERFSDAATEFPNKHRLVRNATRTWEPVVEIEPTKMSEVSTVVKYTTSSDKYKHPKCKRFKEEPVPFEVLKMADIWQTAYYQLSEKVHCFKIHIRKVTHDERKSYNATFGSFGRKVDWGRVFLEIRPMSHTSRRHFLQGTSEDFGVLENIIFSEDKNHTERIPREESPDQWMVFQKLLLMRDCDTGGIVVFSRVPYVPLQRDIEDALKEFGEEFGSGTLACNNAEETVARSYEIEDDDVENL